MRIILSFALLLITFGTWLAKPVDVAISHVSDPSIYIYLPELMKPYPVCTLDELPMCDCFRYGGEDLDCEDFDTQPQAQTCYAFCFLASGYDVYELDQDGDGHACEHLPAQCICEKPPNECLNEGEL